MNKKIPFFKSLKEAQEYLDKIYNLPLYHLAKKPTKIKLVVDNTK